MLKVKAIQLNVQEYYKWASGWRSPIYCDNRKTLSFPEVRSEIAEQFAWIIREKFPNTTCIAGVATGGIAHGALVAQLLHLPFIYVRSSPKGHGLGNQIEGFYNESEKVIVVEDLVSSGMSSLKAVKVLRDQGLSVQGMLSIFDYGFDVAKAAMDKNKCKLYSLSDYDHLLKKAVANKYIAKEMLPTLNKWRENPSKWKP